MKVYELMDRLAEMPAGAEVTVSTVMTAEELKEHDVLEQSEAGEDLYGVVGEPDFVDKASEKRVNLYVSMQARP